MYCGQTVGWIKLPLGTEVGLGPGGIVLDRDPTPPTERGTEAPTFRPTLLWHGRPSQQLLNGQTDKHTDTLIATLRTPIGGDWRVIVTFVGYSIALQYTFGVHDPKLRPMYRAYNASVGLN